MSEVFTEISCHQRNHVGERICGDVFVHRKIKEENRIIAVLSDGMGHGVKANVLATLTATMALNFTEEHKDFIRIADIIMNTLPVCSERQVSYATFTIVDIENNGRVNILEYGNPATIILRQRKNLDPAWQCLILDAERNKGKELRCCTIDPEKEDRIIFCSDGVTQSGMDSGMFTTGWGYGNLLEYCLDDLVRFPAISAGELAEHIVKRAVQNDEFHPKDDISCAVIYFREPRKLLLCTGPPFDDGNDALFASKVADYKGRKILCGATTSDIIAREWGREITDSTEFIDPDLPPESCMDGVDLITEGILTLTKVENILKVFNNNYTFSKGPADKIVRLMMQSDRIEFLIGTRINVAHQEPDFPSGIEMRRIVVTRIAGLLETKFLKDTTLEFF